MNKQVEAFIADEAASLRAHKSIINMLESCRQSVSSSSYEDAAETVFFRQNIDVPMGTPRYQLRKELWKMFISGKFAGK